MNQALINWLANGQRGISSNALFTKLTGIDALGGWGSYAPADPADFNRCLLLLDIAPELRADLWRMKDVSHQWSALVDHWDEVETSFLNEVGFNWSKSKAAPVTYEIMKRIGL